MFQGVLGSLARHHREIHRMTDTLFPLTMLLFFPFRRTMVATIIIKSVIWKWCGAVHGAPGVEAMAQDAKNDVFVLGSPLQRLSSVSTDLVAD